MSSTSRHSRRSFATRRSAARGLIQERPPSTLQTPNLLRPSSHEYITPTTREVIAAGNEPSSRSQGPPSDEPSRRGSDEVSDEQALNVSTSTMLAFRDLVVISPEWLNRLPQPIVDMYKHWDHLCHSAMHLRNDIKSQYKTHPDDENKHALISLSRFCHALFSTEHDGVPKILRHKLIGDDDESYNVHFPVANFGPLGNPREIATIARQYRLDTSDLTKDFHRQVRQYGKTLCTLNVAQHQFYRALGPRWEAADAEADMREAQLEAVRALYRNGSASKSDCEVARARYHTAFEEAQALACALDFCGLVDIRMEWPKAMEPEELYASGWEADEGYWNHGLDVREYMVTLAKMRCDYDRLQEVCDRFDFDLETVR